MSSKLIQKLNDKKLSTKFFGAICIILIILTVLDISYNAKKEREINEEALKQWTYLFAENFRLSLNTLMREGKMDLRFALIENMSSELSDIKDVRIIRGEKTNLLFKEVNEKEVIPRLEKNMKSRNSDMEKLLKVSDRAEDKLERENVKEEIAFLQQELDGLAKRLELANRPIETDPRELPLDALDREVLEKGLSIYSFVGNNARVLIPYTANKTCSKGSGCHRYAKDGDVLGAINIEFSLEAVNRKISENNLVMAGFWVLRFFIFLTVIWFLLRFIITRRLNVLVDACGALSKGDMSVRIPVDGNDEIGIMSNGFNHMAESMELTKKELDKRLLEVFALYSIGKVMNTSFETEQMILELVKDMSRSEQIDRLIIMLRDKKKDEFYSASHTGFKEKDLGQLVRKPGEGFYGKVASSGKGQLVNNVHSGDFIPSEDLLDPEINAVIAVPFFSGGNAVGIICAYKDKPDIFDQADLDLFEGMSEHLSTVLENAKSVEETKIKSITDGMTGLYNKSFFVDTLKAELDKALRYKRELSIFMLDIDNFKHYNDTNGHPEGDELLKELSVLLKKAVRSIDIPCRYGGEEFVVILPETTKKGAAVIAERLLESIRKHYFPYQESQPLGFISVSIGLASYPLDGAEMAPLVKKMDEALYKAKHEGKNRLITA
ncbi:MAG: diguanylate cyclase [bacterium]|nr:diguanylate cyclase [bacterium]